MKTICTFLCLVSLVGVALAEGNEPHPYWNPRHWLTDSVPDWICKHREKEALSGDENYSKQHGYLLWGAPSLVQCAFWKDYSFFFDQFVKDVQTHDSYFQSTWYFQMVDALAEPDDGVQFDTMGLFSDISECKRWHQKALDAEFYVGKCRSNAEEAVVSLDWIENSIWGMSDRWERQRLLRNSGIISIKKSADKE